MVDVNWDLSEKQLKHLGDTTRFLVIEGSAGSGKTIFAAHQTVHYALTHPGARMLVCRQTLPSLRETSWHEIRQVLIKSKIDFDENETKGRIRIPNPDPENPPTTILFRSLDNEEKIRSLSVDYIYVEQAEETSKFSFYELRERLRGEISKQSYGQFLMVVTPGLPSHWFYKLFHVTGVKNSKILHFSYKDNPFISKTRLAEYEELKELDYDLYVKYTEGKWGKTENIIYTNWSIKELEGGAEYYTAGVDFGYNNPSAFILIAWRDGKPYIVDELYERKLTNSELIQQVTKLIARHNLHPNDIQTVFADGAEPDRLVEFMNAGYYVTSGIKNIQTKINAVKCIHLFISQSCTNTLKEIELYSYQRDKEGNILDIPVNKDDHAMDAIGYAIYGTVGVLSPLIGQKTYAKGVDVY